jgi:GNAT superfamily N-acetyltransferase
MRFVSVCTHANDDNDEIEKAAPVRESWLRDNLTKGLKVKVAIDNGKPVGFAHCLPIELGTWGMSGKDLMTIPCLTVKYNYIYLRKTGSGYGRALIEAVESEARKTKKGVAILAYDNDFWFMPASFFKKLGYQQVSKQDDAVIMMKSFEPVDIPVMHKMNFRPALVLNKVVIDAFWNPLCQTSITEIMHVREVCSEYGDRLILNEYDCGEKSIQEKYQTVRALFINGKYKSWGYVAPREGLRQEIDKAFQELNSK